MRTTPFFATWWIGILVIRRIVLLLAGGTGIRASSETPRARAQGYLGAQFLF